MRKSLLAIILLAFAAAVHAADGDWHIYSAYHNATKVVAMHGKIYVLSDGGLYSYDPEDSSVETYDKTNVLSDFGICDIIACDATRELVIVYTNGNIDLMDAGGDTYNMPELKTKTLSDKTINDAIVEDGMLYVSTNSGIVCADLQKRAFADFYDFGQQVLTMVIDNGTIIASTRQGPYLGDMEQNLLAPGNWRKSASNSAYSKYRKVNGVIYAMWSRRLAYIPNPQNVSFAPLIDEPLTDMWEMEGKLYVGTPTGKLYVVAGPTDIKTLDDPYGVNSTVHSQATDWAACGEQGLMGLSIGDELSQKVAAVIPDSPMRNYSYKLNLLGNDRLLMAGGQFVYVAGGDRRATVTMLENDRWTTFDETPYEELGPQIYLNACDVVEDPHDPSHHYVGTARSGVYEFQDFKCVDHFTYDNSPLQTILPNDPLPGAFVRITGLAFDSGNNLWMINNQTDTIVRILKADKSWTAYHIPEVKGYPTFDHTVFDSRGWAWINHRRATTISMAGFVIINTNGDPGNPQGFSHRFIDLFYNQDGTRYEANLMNCICFDIDGNAWFGYDKGIFMSSDPASLLTSTDSRSVLTQVKVPRNDGSNLADYLLSEVPVKCIAIDGGNRKWIGTSGYGVYLVSADGLETFAHYTTDNSPLIDNNIYDIKVNGQTGEVYIATSKGLCSIVGDATDPVAEFDKDLVKVYPNPVRPEYGGNIVIRGLMRDTNVKIVNAAGRLVNEGTSVGGEYTWNGRLQGGKPCASGIYYILGSDADGDNGVVGKFLIVR